MKRLRRTLHRKDMLSDSDFVCRPPCQDQCLSFHSRWQQQVSPKSSKDRAVLLLEAAELLWKELLSGRLLPLLWAKLGQVSQCPLRDGGKAALAKG